MEFVQRKKWIEVALKVNEVDRNTAETVAVRNVSDLLNVLSFVSDCSIKLIGVETSDNRDSSTPMTMRVLTTNEAEDWAAIDQSGSYALLSALGYYRKGLNEPDPFDAFVAFWTAVEIVCSEDDEKSIAGKIDSFARHHNLSIDRNQVADLKGTRNRIVHGSKRYDIDQIKYVAKKLPVMRNLTRQLLEVKTKSSLPRAKVHV